jgi:hypothetical protein
LIDIKSQAKPFATDRKRAAATRLETVPRRGFVFAIALK